MPVINFSPYQKQQKLQQIIKTTEKKKKNRLPLLRKTSFLATERTTLHKLNHHMELLAELETRPSLVGGECSQHCTTLALPMLDLIKGCMGAVA